MSAEDLMKVWDRRYSEYGKERSQQEYDYWLKPYRSDLLASGATPILDLGCGTGHDTDYLNLIGCRVVAADFSMEALKIVRRRTARAGVVQLDIENGLPFPAMQFQVIIACLSLHYFPLDKTQTIVSDVRRHLRDNGMLLARFNSISDNECQENGHVRKLHHHFFVDEVMKSFFSEEGLLRLFAHGWRIETLVEREVHRYGRDKVIWEVAARRESRD